MEFTNKLKNVIYSYLNDSMKYLKILNINHKFFLLFFVLVLINYINTGIIFSKDSLNEDNTYYLKNDNYQSRMILQIHDELLFESPKDEISELEKMIKDKMVNAMPLEVPLVVDCGQGISWFDAH